MELGITSFAETVVDPATGRHGDHGARLRDVVAEVELAEQVGLDVYALGEHHRADFAASAPVVTLAAAAARTSTIRLSTAVTVLSSADPVRTFQDFATLDLLSGGRAEIMAGRGSFTESFPLFGYDLGDYDALFEEKLELLLAIRDNERVTWSGRFRPALQDQPVFPRPQQDPLPIWVGVGGNPESVIRAGLLGLPMALAIIGGSPRAFAPLADLHREALRHAGHDPRTTPVAVHAHGWIAGTSQEAERQFYPSYAEGRNAIGRERGWPALTEREFRAMVAPEGSLFLGSPQQVAEKILALRESLGIERFMLHISPGRLSHREALRTIELLGTEVAPLVRAAVGPATVEPVAIPVA